MNELQAICESILHFLCHSGEHLSHTACPVAKLSYQQFAVERKIQPKSNHFCNELHEVDLARC